MARVGPVIVRLVSPIRDRASRGDWANRRWSRRLGAIADYLLGAAAVVLAMTWVTRVEQINGVTVVTMTRHMSTLDWSVVAGVVVIFGSLVARLWWLNQRDTQCAQCAICASDRVKDSPAEICRWHYDRAVAALLEEQYGWSPPSVRARRPTR